MHMLIHLKNYQVIIMLMKIHSYIALCTLVMLFISCVLTEIMAGQLNTIGNVLLNNI